MFATTATVIGIFFIGLLVGHTLTKK
ncbi:hypothetical protein GA-1p46 [Bacillus phage GA1]|uniref:Uncharacterized protein n=1 Tax=Bacillus phage GA-1 TaxID=2679898 RepID=Q9FZV2_BPGA1|nr:hypothetical protein GA-1p46 [Bacillus phage GA1]CAC21544.1 hypothetical protein [Bacillus phage GA1]